VDRLICKHLPVHSFCECARSDVVVWVQVCASVCVRVCVCESVCKCVCGWVCEGVCVWVCVNVWMHVCGCMQVYAGVLSVCTNVYYLFGLKKWNKWDVANLACYFDKYVEIGFFFWIFLFAGIKFYDILCSDFFLLFSSFDDKMSNSNFSFKKVFNGFLWIEEEKWIEQDLII
jgi:hypothetical protein